MNNRYFDKDDGDGPINYLAYVINLENGKIYNEKIKNADTDTGTDIGTEVCLKTGDDDNNYDEIDKYEEDEDEGGNKDEDEYLSWW